MENSDNIPAKEPETESKPEAESTEPAYTYMLKCADGTFYIGWTNDLGHRLAAHNAGTGSKYTRVRRPVELVYYETFFTKQEAMSREWHMKRLSRREKEKLISNS